MVATGGLEGARLLLKESSIRFIITVLQGTIRNRLNKMEQAYPKLCLSTLDIISLNKQFLPFSYPIPLPPYSTELHIHNF